MNFFQTREVEINHFPEVGDRLELIEMGVGGTDLRGGELQEDVV